MPGPTPGGFKVGEHCVYGVLLVRLNSITCACPFPVLCFVSICHGPPRAAYPSLTCPDLSWKVALPVELLRTFTFQAARLNDDCSSRFAVACRRFFPLPVFFIVMHDQADGPKRTAVGYQI